MEKYQRSSVGSTGRKNPSNQSRGYRQQQPNKPALEPEEQKPSVAAMEPLKEQVYIEYMGRILNLGNSWPQLVLELDRNISDKKLCLAIQICLVRRLSIPLPAAELQRLMDSYANMK